MRLVPPTLENLRTKERALFADVLLRQNPVRTLMRDQRKEWREKAENGRRMADASPTDKEPTKRALNFPFAAVLPTSEYHHPTHRA